MTGGRTGGEEEEGEEVTSAAEAAEEGATGEEETAGREAEATTGGEEGGEDDEGAVAGGENEAARMRALDGALQQEEGIGVESECSFLGPLGSVVVARRRCWAEAAAKLSTQGNVRMYMR